MRTRFTIPIAIGLAALLTTGPADAAQPNSDGTAVRPQEDQSTALVILNGEPLSTALRTKPAQGKKIDFNSTTVKAYRARLNTVRNNFKKWLNANAPKANVTGKFDISLNAVSVQLNGESLATLKSCTLVKDAQYQTYYYPTVDDPDLALIKAVQAWQVGGGPTNAGAEVKVAIIDTGIDIRHPCFSGAGYPSKTQLGDRRFTNNKVIAARVFNNKTSQNYTPEAIQEHGTHVAGTVACNYNTPASVNGVAISHGISGVAPRALLGNYNVFPGHADNARSEDILNALEAAYEDGFDIANMSLGGRPKSGNLGVQDIVTVAVDNLDKANMVVAVASGNSGPGFDTVESPGSAARALTAGAATAPHYIATPVIVGGRSAGALSGDFTVVTNDLTAPLAVITNADGSLGTACAALAGGSLNGKIALISRGACSFSAKIRAAQAAGAVAVVMVNNAPGDPIPMGQDGTPNQPTIPAYMLSRTDGLALVNADGASATISATAGYFITANGDFMGSFSSQGPTEVDFRVKPDVVAPGVNVLSSIPVSSCGGQPCFAFFQGTSMATPHLAGSAAVVRWLYPNWSAAQVRSAIVNTADKDVLKQAANGNPERNVNIVGAGRENLLAAVNAAVTLDPVSVSYGAVPSGSGQVDDRKVRIKNVSAGTLALSISVGPGDASVFYSVSPATLSLTAGQTGVVTITMRAAKEAAEGNHQSTLSINAAGSEIAHAAVYTLIK